jgi:carbohydrate-selective porin OprB
MLEVPCLGIRPASALLAIAFIGGLLFTTDSLDARSEPEAGFEAHPSANHQILDAPANNFFSTTDDPADARMICPLLRRDCGVSLEPVYYGEVFTNARGGISARRATQYEALLDLPLTLDFEKMQLPLPGRFFFLAQNTHGRGLTEDFIGDTQVISNIDSGDNIAQVSEYWWEFGLLEDTITVRLGKQDVNTEFLLVEMAEDFIQSSFGLSPSSAGLPTYPDPSMGAVVLGQLTPSLRLKLGIWDGLADGGSWGFSGNDVILLIGELEYKYSLLDGLLPGVLELGLARNTDGIVSGVPFPSEWGYYIQWEQLIYRERTCDPDDAQGLGVFALYLPRFGGGPVTVSTLETIEDSAAAGVVYRGLIPRRDDDVVGAGIAWARLNQGGTPREIVVEGFYRVQVTPSMSVQPDIQYIVTPSGIHPDALAVGVRFQVAL